MRHIDLFSGIGGFALAVDEVWPGSEHIFCEIDPFCQALLKKRFEGSVIYGDIRQLTADTASNGRRSSKAVTDEKGHAEESRQAGVVEGGFERPCSSRVDLLTGGFPCQPFSQAGKRRGTSDNRFLWPEMLRVIREFQPTWIIAENVRGILTIEQGMVFEQVCVDMETEGYEVQPFIIPAVAVNAPHRRDRVWFVANKSRAGLERQAGTSIHGSGEGLASRDINAPDTEAMRPQGDGGVGQAIDSEDGRQALSKCDNCSEWQRNWLEVATEYGRMDDGISDWMERCIETIIGGNYAKTINADGQQDLLVLRQEIQKDEVWEKLGRLFPMEEKEILLSLLCRVEKESNGQNDLSPEGEKVQKNSLRGLWHPIENGNNGRASQGREHQEQLAKELKNIVPPLSYAVALEIAKVWHNLSLAHSSYVSPAVELDGLKLSKARHRVERLKALGNSIVPQVAIEIMKAIILTPQEWRKDEDHQVEKR